MSAIYETDKLLAEYLLFHFGTADEILPPSRSWPEGMRGALDFPVRTAAHFTEGTVSCGLDLGCAVGRSAFELSRSCQEVIGIDFSHAFIAAAQALAGGASIPYERLEEASQVTPLVAIAPLLIIYFGEQATVYIAATIVAFFPILSNTMTGLRSTDHGLLNLFQLCKANGWQRLIRLELPSALPYFLTGLRIAGGLALIGAIVAEFVAGSAGQGSGLAFRIVESGYRLNIPRMFAALLMISFAGVILYFGFALASHMALRKWHESALKRES